MSTTVMPIMRRVVVTSGHSRPKPPKTCDVNKKSIFYYHKLGPGRHTAARNSPIATTHQETLFRGTFCNMQATVAVDKKLRTRNCVASAEMTFTSIHFRTLFGELPKFYSDRSGRHFSCTAVMATEMLTPALVLNQTKKGINQTIQNNTRASARSLSRT